MGAALRDAIFREVWGVDCSMSPRLAIRKGADAEQGVMYEESLKLIQ